MTPKPARDQRLIEGVIGSTSLFRGISPLQVALLATRCSTLAPRRLDVIVEHGARPPGLIAVVYGTVMLSLRNGGLAGRVLRLVNAAQTFADASALLGRACPYEARAMTECKLVVIPAAAVLDLAEREPRAARQVMLNLAKRDLDLVAQLQSLSMRRGEQRLASYLRELSQPGERTVRLPATKTVVASQLDMKKETLSRLLRKLAEKGIIRMAQRDITILDTERLVATAA